MAQNATPMWTDLRSKYFDIPRGPSFPQPTSATEPWGAIMEVGHAPAIVTTVAFSDGTASVVRSTGGGFFGGGDATVQEARVAFLREAALAQPQSVHVTEFPHPGIGAVMFYFRSDSGVCSVSGLIEALGQRGHPLNSLFVAASRILHEYLQLQKRTAEG